MARARKRRLRRSWPISIGANFDEVVVHHGDTDNTAQGNGTMGSRGLVVGGGALMLSLDKIREKINRIAAHMLEVAVEDIELVNDRYQVKGTPDRSVDAGAGCRGSLRRQHPEGNGAGT